MEYFDDRHLYMTESEKAEETRILDIVTNKKLTMKAKAEMLHYTKKRVVLDGSLKMCWVNSEMDLFLNLKSLMKSKKKRPLGFDFYYWGYESFKMKLK